MLIRIADRPQPWRKYAAPAVATDVKCKTIPADCQFCHHKILLSQNRISKSQMGADGAGIDRAQISKLDIRNKAVDGGWRMA
jgi:hypothetical protein